MNKIYLAILLLPFYVLTTITAQTQVLDQSSPPDPITVGIYVSPPFVSKEDAHFTGMAIELWEKAADALHLKYSYREYPSFEALINATQTGEMRAAVSNITISRDRATRIAFSQPWYDAGLRIMVADNERGSFWQVLGGLERAGHLRAMAWLIAFVIIATVLLALFYRRFDKTFPRQWHAGLAESFYEVMSVATSGKVTRPNILGWIGRLSGGLWMVCGVAVIAYVTSSVTSVMTALSLTHQINSVADLPGRTVGVLGGSIAEQYGQELRLDVRPFPDIQRQVTALTAGEIDAVIGDAPVLEYYAHSNPVRSLSVVGAIFHPDKYGFGFKLGDPLAHEITLQILDHQETGDLGVLRRKYFGNAP
ncbi:transporter substrate-binding domain-containing protein [Brucella tritici]|uniref:transporter substrate-binding domain-containing protein n=1 Tax=Brucella tritici TaxID=94626 RepID=UPI002000AE20|nr:transporter substrate-binding domain-containing protein [Brucella tritici]